MYLCKCGVTVCNYCRFLELVLYIPFYVLLAFINNVHPILCHIKKGVRVCVCSHHAIYIRSKSSNIFEISSDSIPLGHSIMNATHTKKNSATVTVLFPSHSVRHSSPHSAHGSVVRNDSYM